MKTGDNAQENARGPRLFRNARLATVSPGMPGLGLVEKGALAIENGKIAYAGSEADLPAALNKAETIDLEGRWITPGLIDCHTHLIYAGNRAHEFELRLRGASYEEIARAGGGIVSTVKHTREADQAELVRQALPRLDALIAEGATTVEIKSGYGLDLENEAKALRAARQLGVERPVTIRTTFLGAHALPTEAKGDKTAYIQSIVKTMLPEIAKENLADAVDAFCEGIAFSPEEVTQVFEAAAALNLPVKLHADQLSNLRGAMLAAKFKALSADHLEHTDEAGAAAMGKAGTVAVLLPGAFYFMRDTRQPPIALFRQYGVPMAVSTDSNPGTSPLTSILMSMNLAATLFRLSVDECIAGVTREAARALGLGDDIGTLDVGKGADLAIWDIERPAELVYRMGFNPLYKRIWRGQ
jgi:imidazolonepropionase